MAEAAVAAAAAEGAGGGLPAQQYSLHAGSHASCGQLMVQLVRLYTFHALAFVCWCADLVRLCIVAATSTCTPASRANFLSPLCNSTGCAACAGGHA